jgi:hypothetical protein
MADFDGSPSQIDVRSFDRIDPRLKGSRDECLSRSIVAFGTVRETNAMNETARQYIQRITGHVEGKQPLAVQAATAKKLDRLIKGVPTSRLRKRPAADKWSVGEIVAHLADAEIVIGFRMRMILGAPGTPIAAYDQDSWVTSGHYARRDPRKSVEQFRVVREANLALLASLTPDQWKQYGMHSERGQETIEQIVRMTAGHDMNHVQQIALIVPGKRK